MSRSSYSNGEIVASQDATPVTDVLVHIAMDIQNYKGVIATALPYTNGTHTLDDVCLAVLSGKLKLWTAPKSVIISEFVNYPRKKYLHYFLIAGDMEEIIAMQSKIIEFAHRNHCDAISGLGRPGWEKITKRLGWQTHERYCILDLYSDEEHHGQGRRNPDHTIDIEPSSGVHGDAQEELRIGGERL